MEPTPQTKRSPLHGAQFLVLCLASAGLISWPLSGRCHEVDFAPRRVSAPGCNSTALAQVPRSPDLFVARALQADQAKPCSGIHWQLDLEQMDWGKLQLKNQRSIFRPPIVIADGADVVTAFDPSVALFDGEYWVAFECAGPGISGSSTCVGPANLESPTSKVDRLRTHVVIGGSSHVPGATISYTASVPKLLALQDKLYLYWDAIRYWKVMPAGRTVIRPSDRWISIAERGAELVEEPKSGTLWVAGASGPVASDDPGHSVEVWAPISGDARSDNVVDLFDVTVYGNLIYAIGSIGGDGCLRPLDASDGCYRMALAMSRVPLGFHIFNRHQLPEGLLPSSPQDYSHFVRQPGRGVGLLTHLYRPQGMFLIDANELAPILRLGETQFR
jgi:hypothetical protein